MQVILCEDVDNLGEMGQTVKVPRLRPQFPDPPQAGRAGRLRQRQADRARNGQIIKRREERRRAEIQGREGPEKITVDIKVRAGEGDKIFGSVTAGHIAEKLAEMGREVNRKNISWPSRSSPWVSSRLP
jgi:large subunit ribosomal protein L9